MYLTSIFFPAYHDFRYVQAYAQIIYENELENFMAACGPETRFVTSQLEPESPYRAPKWLDKPKVGINHSIWLQRVNTNKNFIDPRKITDGISPPILIGISC
jgi:hypothetical protein